MRAAKIVATVGPASDSEEILRQLVQAGADVFRLNLSHGEAAEHAARARAVRRISDELGRNTGVLVDLQGPKIRLGRFENGGCTLETGARFTLTIEPVTGNCDRASTSYARLPADVSRGARIVLNDGAVELRVLESDGVSVRCEVVSGGRVADRKGINLPGVKVSAPALTDRDKAGLETMLREPVDFVALSFVRSPEDVAALRRFLDEHGRRLPVVAKVEKPEGWEALDGILDESDGVMVARGDLGVEMALEKVPFIQKSIIARARRRGKFCITATQMLESMIDSPMPTRAEVSDVANAIADGTDAVMLSAETSAGRHPLEAVRQMARIAEEAGGLKPPPLPEETDRTHADLIADAACEAAESGSVSAIVVFTLSGGSARLVARYRPPVPIYAFTPSAAVARQLAVVYDVATIVTPELRSTDDVVAHVDRWLTGPGRLPRNAAVAIVAGFPPGRPGNTNLLRLHRLGS